MIRFSQVTKRYPNGHEALKQMELPRGFSIVDVRLWRRPALI